MFKTTMTALALSCFGPMAHAVSVTLDFSSPATGCGTGVTIAGALVVDQNQCHVTTINDHQYLVPGSTFSISALAGASFDFTGANILYYESETFKLPASQVPAGLDLTNPADANLMNTNDWLWTLAPNDLPMISVNGYSGGALVSSFGDIFPDTLTHNASIGYTPPSSALDWDTRSFPGTPMTGLDRLDITFGQPIANTTPDTPVLIGDTWYMQLGGGSILVFDDMTLDVTQSSISPTPVPLPMGGAMLIGGLGLLGMAGRRPRRSAG